VRVGRPRKLAPEREAALVCDYEQGWTNARLCWAYEISLWTLYRILGAHGVTRAHKKRAEEQDEARPRWARCPECHGMMDATLGHPRCGTTWTPGRYTEAA
jgi:hypothetical protein